MRLRPATKPEDPGGVVERPEPVTARRVLGARFRAAGDLVELTHVYVDGAAQAAGLSAGDRLVALDGIQVRADTLAARVAQLEPGRPAGGYLRPVVHPRRRA
jgi:predicted metalloprotease with PDZ domain